MCRMLTHIFYNWQQANRLYRRLLHSVNQQLHSYSAMGKRGAKAAAKKSIAAKKDDAVVSSSSHEDITIVTI